MAMWRGGLRPQRPAVTPRATAAALLVLGWILAERAAGPLATAYLTAKPSLKIASAAERRPGRGRTTRRATASVSEQQPLVPLDAGLPLPAQRPGSKDHAIFREGESVAFWQSFVSAESNLLGRVDLAGEDASYWLYHLGRTGFFAAQGLTSVLAAQVSAFLSDGDRSAVKEVTPQFVQNLVKKPREQISARLQEGVATFSQDLGFIKKGLFKKPYDMSLRHRQFSPFFVADKGIRYLQEAVSTLQRMGQKADTNTRMESSGDVYPSYYKHAFHYQTDGWLSSDSAEVYESTTETLFLGRQDAMQRTTLVHLAGFLESWRQTNGASGSTSSPRLLEIACGTGRFMTFVRDNWPELEVTASDLSPYYLEKARENGAYWESQFARRAEGGNQRRGQARYMQANAEALPFKDESFDVVTSVYLFHELPAEAQDAVVAEAARVLAPGGMFVVTDSIQLGDRPFLDNSIGNFVNFAEPHYADYIRRDLAQLARDHGLVPDGKELSSSTKSVSFYKPPSSGGPQHL